MVGVKAHCGGSSPLYWTATPLSVLLPIISIGSLVSNTRKTKKVKGLTIVTSYNEIRSITSLQETRGNAFCLVCEEGTESPSEVSLVYPATSLQI